MAAITTPARVLPLQYLAHLRQHGNICGRSGIDEPTRIPQQSRTKIRRVLSKCQPPNNILARISEDRCTGALLHTVHSDAEFVVAPKALLDVAPQGQLTPGVMPYDDRRDRPAWMTAFTPSMSPSARLSLRRSSGRGYGASMIVVGSSGPVHPRRKRSRIDIGKRCTVWAAGKDQACGRGCWLLDSSLAV